MTEEVFVGGNRYTLGKRIGKGGEGEVFQLEASKPLALKRYTDNVSREAKISAMAVGRLVSNKT